MPRVDRKVIRYRSKNQLAVTAPLRSQFVIHLFSEWPVFQPDEDLQAASGFKEVPLTPTVRLEERN